MLCLHHAWSFSRVFCTTFALTQVRFTELDAAGKVVARAQHRVPGVLARMLTDFVVTEHWWVFAAHACDECVCRAWRQWLSLSGGAL